MEREYFYIHNSPKTHLFKVTYFCILERSHTYDYPGEQQADEEESNYYQRIASIKYSAEFSGDKPELPPPRNSHNHNKETNMTDQNVKGGYADTNNVIVDEESHDNGRGKKRKDIHHQC